MPPLHGSRQAGLSVILSPCHHLLPRSRNINSHSLITATIPPRHLHSRLTSPSTSKYRQQHQFLIQNHNSPRPFSTTPPSPPSNPTPTPLTPEKYHTLSDTYIDALVTQLEELQEQREDVDVEYSAGVLTLTLPPHGTYVLNKQPPNKQIWLSSPVSGPKRYDWVEGEWVYLRDGSTLGGLLGVEMGVKMGGGEGD